MSLGILSSKLFKFSLLASYLIMQAKLTTKQSSKFWNLSAFQTATIPFNLFYMKTYFNLNCCMHSCILFWLCLDDAKDLDKKNVSSKTGLINTQLPSVVEIGHLYYWFFSISSESICIYWKAWAHRSGEYNKCVNSDGLPDILLKYVIKLLALCMCYLDTSPSYI